MNGIFEWLIKLLFIAMLAPFFLSMAFSLAGAVFAAVLPWVLAMATLIGVTAGIAAGIMIRRRLPQPPHRFPAGEVPRIRRPRGIRTER